MGSSGGIQMAYATANISPARFVSLTEDGVVENGAVQSDGTLPILGVSQEGLCVWNSDYAATTDYPSFCVYSGIQDDPMLELGANVSAGQFLISDGNGKGTPASLTSTSKQYVGAQAMQNGLSGQKIRVRVLPQIVGQLA